jgi:hypothetical protein
LKFLLIEYIIQLLKKLRMIILEIENFKKEADEKIEIVKIFNKL